jgi:2-polyprenyl-3-methyl-5-hydroxy-6-metoxy-1,4-benzoquinol methylase
MAQVTEDSTNRYLNGEYLAENPDWHEDDSPWKAGHIGTILDRNGVVPKNICEVGCGTGGVVEALADRYTTSEVVGYEISPQAYERCLMRSKPNLGFVCGSPFESDKHFDVLMAIDVIEHVENPFEFVRSMRRMSNYQVFHIPLDMNALATARGWVIMDARHKIGHLHYFTRDTALSLLEECGLTVVDSFYTPWAIDQSYKTWKKRLAAWPRRIAFGLSPHATVRAIGGWSLMVLAKPRS